MIAELVRTQTEDGLRLDGALHGATAPADGRPPRRSLDAVILLHGVGSNFYGSTLIERVSRGLLELGLTVLRVNTRGHDGVSTAATARGGRQVGAAYEIVDECRQDVEAWTRFLEQRDLRRIALVGHSLGALKAIYAQAHSPQTTVHQIVAISPPRLAYSRFVQSPAADVFTSSLREAMQWVEGQQPGRLFQATFPFPLILSAATYLDKYGPHERYDLVKLAWRLQTPVAFVFGQLELTAANPAFARIVEDIQAVNWLAPYSLEVVPQADHSYAGNLARLVEVVQQTLSGRHNGK